MTTAILARLATRLRSIEDELATSIQRTASQSLDSVATAARDIDELLMEARVVAVPGDTATIRELLSELEEALHCGRSVLADPEAPGLERRVVRMIGHVHAARAAVAVAS